MDKTLRNTFIGSILVMISAIVGSWVQVNSRIAVLEVQVQNDHEAMQENNKSIDEMKAMLVDIQKGVQHLQDVKKDK